ncbi:hypothetical protein [Pseudoalteromonas sp. P1-25]|uniref:hypothetical protein n=1 Tax=Pseudoalteromonas sp. P1-25 TaxID=1723758 RepID=UPI00128F2FDD|nr:hypothetical protein [Pseudoalteromonas sp. P1-25]
MMKIYYETTISFNSIEFLPYVLFIVISLIFIGRLKKLYDLYIKRFFKFNFFVLFFIFILYNLASTASLYLKMQYIAKIKSHEQRVVAGEIEKLVEKEGASRTQSFLVSGVFFKYNNYQTAPYFFANRAYNDKVIFNGGYVEIHYIQDNGNNYITKLFIESD